MRCIMNLQIEKTQDVIPYLKYVRGEHLSNNHWVELYRIIGLCFTLKLISTLSGIQSSVISVILILYLIEDSNTRL